MAEDEKIVTSAVAVPAGSPPPSIPVWQEEKKGGKCCGCCCDYRRAVIILSIIGIVIGVLGMILRPYRQTATFADDDLEKQVEDIQDIIYKNNLILGITSIVMNVVNLIGAVIFFWPAVSNLNIVAVAFLWREDSQTVFEF